MNKIAKLITDKIAGKHFNLPFDKHKSQWFFNKESGTIDKDEENLNKVAKKKTNPNADFGWY